LASRPKYDTAGIAAQADATQTDDTDRLDSWRKLQPDSVRFFDECRSGDALWLGEKDFAKAIQMALPRLRTAQVKALWEGIVNGTRKIHVTLDDFCHCAQAVDDDDALAEFADMSVETFQSLREDAAKVPRLSKEQAVMTLQAWLKSLPARHLIATQRGVEIDLHCASVSTKGTQYLDAVARTEQTSMSWRSLRPQLTKIFQESLAYNDDLDGNCGLGERGFARAMRKAIPRLSDEQTDSLWKGITAGTLRSYVGLGVLCQCVDAGENDDDALAEFADMFVEAFQSQGPQKKRKRRGAATKILAMLRMLQEKRKVVEKAETDIHTVDSDDADVLAFSEALTQQGGNSKGLLQPAFQTALLKAHPELVPAQVKLLWNGIMANSYATDVDETLFCLLSMSLSFSRGSEFADIPHDEFVALAKAPNAA
jgi:hypothetical protein